MTRTAPGLDSLLAAALAAQLGEPVTVTAAERLKGGYSRQMWAFEASIGDGPARRLILCADNPDGVVDHGNALGRVEEFQLLRVLGSAGLPVPPVLLAGDGSDPLGRPYLVMDRIDGTAAVGPLVREQRYIERHDDFGRQKAQILAALHRVPVPTEIYGTQLDADGAAPREAARWRAAFAAMPEALTPVLRSALAWLDTHPPSPPERIVLVHGDFRTGNLMYGPEGIRAILDWEMAHPGDPLEDLAFAQLVSWQIGTGRVGGLVEPRRWVELYAEATGRPVDCAALQFWEVLAAVKMSALTYRVSLVLPAGKERDLLIRMGRQLREDLKLRLLRN
jgi:aminoglycoside phosphotransferase (APT) family kinase protein